jgi:hypothetical protein
LNQARPGPAKSFTEEATVYWLLVSAILLGYVSFAIGIAAGILYFIFALVLAVVELVLAYACWTRTKWGFLASTLSAIVVAGLAFGILYSPVGDLLLLLQLQVVFFAYRAHRELVSFSTRLWKQTIFDYSLEKSATNRPSSHKIRERQW